MNEQQLWDEMIATHIREGQQYAVQGCQAAADHHLWRLLVEWVTHYNEERPHMSLGPSPPQPSVSVPGPLPKHRHGLAALHLMVSCPVLGGLHHDYRLEQKAA